jgi:RNA recognition motif-containing protein
MEIKLYVGNLPFSTTEAALRQMFSLAGNVTSVDLIQDQGSGQSKGFAFVTLSTQAEAQKAITQFNASLLAGRTLKVTIAKVKTAQSGYQSQLGAFALADHRLTKVKPPQLPAAPGGYQSRLSAFGAGSLPLEPRRRGRSQRR